jgi:TrmH family RNA methyltransferase
MYTDKIISKSNEKVKYIKSLNEKKNRQKYNAFYVEGIKVLEEIINSEKAIDVKFIAYSKTILLKVKNGDILFDKAQKFCKLKNIEFLDIEDKIFEYVTDTITSQGILAVVKIKNKDVDKLLYENKQENILILDKIQDGGNVGTIIRSADAFGINLIFCVNGTTDIYSPKVIRSTMGSIFRVNVIYIDKQDLDIIIYKIKDNGHLIITTDLNAKEYIKDIDFNKKYAFVFGNESNGVSEELKSVSDLKVKIPIQSTTESLNVSIATGIILYEQFKNK